MKKFTVLTALMMAAAMIITLTACGTDAPVGETTTDPLSEAETETVIVQVTDANGEVVTDASGEAVTRIETVDVPTKNNDGQQSGGTGAGQQTGGKDTGEKTNGTGTGGSQGGGSGSGQQGGTSGGNGGTSGGSGSGNGGSSNGGGSVTPTPTPEPNPAPTPTPQRTWEYLPDLSRQTFDAMNQFRKDNGVAPLAYNKECQDLANKQAKWCAENNAVDHGLLEISIGTESCSTASGFIALWASSPGHKKSMLRETNVNGAVSVYKDSTGYYFVIAHFDDGQDWEWQ